MTTIAYKDGVMAADRSLTYKHEWCGNVQKVWKFDTGCLYGARGEGDDRALRALLSKVKTPDDLPTAITLAEIENDVTALFVFPHGEVWTVRSGKDSAEAMKIDGRFHAIGSGRKYALGAMFAGADAGHAVIAAKVFDLHTDGGTDVVTLDSHTPKFPGIENYANSGKDRTNVPPSLFRDMPVQGDG